MPADPETKGGSEATVRIAKADLASTDANLRDDYRSWTELVEACDELMEEVNDRAHRVTRRPPVEMLAEEAQRLHRLPERPYTTVLGETRKVSWTSSISFSGVTHSVPHHLVDESVGACRWRRGRRVSLPAGGCHRSCATSPGHAGHAGHAGDRRCPLPATLRRPAGPSAQGYERGRERVPRHRGRRTQLARRRRCCGHEPGEGEDGRSRHSRPSPRRRPGDWALGHAATFGRFAEGDLASILAPNPPGQRRSADDIHSLQPGTGAWHQLGGGVQQ